MSARDVRDYAKKTGFGRELYAVLDIDGHSRTTGHLRLTRSMEPKDWPQRCWISWLKLRTARLGLPDEAITKSQFRILRSLVYGIDTFRGLFNDRQLYVLGTLCEAVRAAHKQMLTDGMEAERALAVSTYLALTVDRIADYDSSFCGWQLLESSYVIPLPGKQFAWSGTT